MIIVYGMSDKIGPISLKVDDVRELEFYGTAIEDEIGKEIRNIIDIAYARAMQILNENRDKLDAVAMALIEKETITEELQKGEYLTTFPMPGNKPSIIEGPIKAESSNNTNGKYYFIVQGDGKLRANNIGVNNSTANSYFTIDLTKYPSAEVEIIINATINNIITMTEINKNFFKKFFMNFLLS